MNEVFTSDTAKLPQGVEGRFFAYNVTTKTARDSATGTDYKLDPKTGWVKQPTEPKQP